MCLKLQAGLGLRDFALVQLENLCHFLDLWVTAIDIDVL